REGHGRRAPSYTKSMNRPDSRRSTAEKRRLLGGHHRVGPLTPSLSPEGRGRPLDRSAPVAPLSGGGHRPLLPAGEKVPEGRMRGSPAVVSSENSRKKAHGPPRH